MNLRAPGAHVVDQLEPYFLGELPADQEFDVEEHVLGCVDCRAEWERLGELGLLLAMLPEGTVVAARAQPAGPAPPTATIGAGESPHSATTGWRARRSRSPRRSGPPGRSDSPSGRRRPWSGVVGWVATLVLAAVLGVFVGRVAWDWLTPAATGVPVNETRNGLPGRLSVTVTNRADGTLDVGAVVVGLTPGVHFELLAVAPDHRTYVVVSGEASGGPQQLVGSVPASRVLMFMVVQADGTVVAISVP